MFQWKIAQILFKTLYAVKEKRFPHIWIWSKVLGGGPAVLKIEMIYAH